jgi:hypothetical protein
MSDFPKIPALKGIGIPALPEQPSKVGPIRPALPGDTIKASPDKVAEHVEHLKKFTYQQMLDDAVRDPSDSNLAIIRIVADMRLATTQQRTLIATWAAVAVALVAVIISLGSVVGWW